MDIEYKGYKIVPDGKFGYYSVAPLGKGSVNMVLRGLYTKTIEAMKAIDTFTDKEVGSSGKNKRTSRG